MGLGGERAGHLCMKGGEASVECRWFYTTPIKEDVLGGNLSKTWDIT